MKKIIYLLFTVFLFSCSGQGTNKPESFIDQDYVNSIFDTTHLYYRDSVEENRIADSINREELRKDSIQLINFKKTTKIINGGYNGLDDRTEIFLRALEILKDTL